MNVKKILGADFGKVDSKYGLKLTMLGIGVLNKDGQVSVYDKKAGTITTVPNDLSIGDIPFFAIPTNEIAAGDLVIHNGLIKVVSESDADGGVIAVNVRDQTEEVIIVAKNLFGYKNIAKIVSLFDPAGGGDSPFGGDLMKNPLMLMMLMGDKGDSLFGGDGDSMLPLLMMSQGGAGFGDLAKNPLMMMALLGGL